MKQVDVHLRFTVDGRVDEVPLVAFGGPVAVEIVTTSKGSSVIIDMGAKSKRVFFSPAAEELLRQQQEAKRRFLKRRKRRKQQPSS